MRTMPCSDQALGWELLSPETVCRLGEFRGVDLEQCRTRLERGDSCYTVTVDGRLAHVSWVQSSGVHWLRDAGFSVNVQSGHFWIYHCITTPWARGRGLYPQTLVHICRDFAARGAKTAWIYTSKGNIASQKGISRAGFRQIADFPAIRFGDHYLRLTAGRHSSVFTGGEKPQA
jgi:hypothetical protein